MLMASAVGMAACTSCTADDPFSDSYSNGTSGNTFNGGGSVTLSQYSSTSSLPGRR